MPSRPFAVEHYDDTGGHVAPLNPFPAIPAGVHLTGAVYLPADEVVIAFIEGARRGIGRRGGDGGRVASRPHHPG